MGILLGRPDPDTPRTLVVTDAFPLPIEGFETRVVADDANVVNHMIALGECLELTRHEKFMGWYHSHPFDLGPNSHCFLSQTDLSTQLQWQRAEDPHGNPFVALVVDPLRSIHRGMPEIEAFRAYPPEYNAPTPNECPDGSIVANEQTRLELWGSCWNRYYSLQVEYFMSSHARKVLEQLTQDYLWMRTLSRRPHDEMDAQHHNLAEQLRMQQHPCWGSNPSRPLRHLQQLLLLRTTTTSNTLAMGSFSPTMAGEAALPDVSKAVDRVVDLASQQLYATTMTKVKKQVFSVGNAM
jgi:proteasome lid subunit RPN8/RPN11